MLNRRQFAQTAALSSLSMTLGGTSVKADPKFSAEALVPARRDNGHLDVAPMIPLAYDFLHHDNHKSH